MPARRAPHPRRLAGGGGAMGVLTALVAWVGREVVLAGQTVAGWDQSVSDRATAWTAEIGARVPLIVWARLTEPVVLYSALSVLAILLVARGRLPRWRLWVIPVGLTVWALTITCKQLVDRPRPPETVAHAAGWSYPSGHASGSTTALALLCWLVWPLLRRSSQRATVVALAVAVVLLTCLDRVLLGVHYPSDVVAGAVLGGSMTAAALLALRGRS